MIPATIPQYIHDIRHMLACRTCESFLHWLDGNNRDVSVGSGFKRLRVGQYVIMHLLMIKIGFEHA